MLTIPTLIAIAGIIVFVAGLTITIRETFDTSSVIHSFEDENDTSRWMARFTTDGGLAAFCIGAALLMLAAGLGYLSN